MPIIWPFRGFNFDAHPRLMGRSILLSSFWMLRNLGVWWGWSTLDEMATIVSRNEYNIMNGEKQKRQQDSWKSTCHDRDFLALYGRVWWSNESHGLVLWCLYLDGFIRHQLICWRILTLATLGIPWRPRRRRAGEKRLGARKIRNSGLPGCGCCGCTGKAVGAFGMGCRFSKNQDFEDWQKWGPPDREVGV